MPFLLVRQTLAQRAGRRVPTGLEGDIIGTSLFEAMLPKSRGL
jgi:hypothetical protein